MGIKPGAKPVETMSTELYLYSQLDDDAQEQARNWWIESMDFNAERADDVIDDAKHLFSLFGWAITSVDYSGFYCQGDHAAFKGTWRAEAVKPGALAHEAPPQLDPRSENNELNRLASIFESAAALYPDLSISATPRGRYSSMDIDIHSEIDYAQALTDSTRDLADWIYDRLKADYEYIISPASIAEAMEANEYTFTQEGERLG